jgi:hypothetical protein
MCAGFHALRRALQCHARGLSALARVRTCISSAMYDVVAKCFLCCVPNPPPHEPSARPTHAAYNTPRGALAFVRGRTHARDLTRTNHREVRRRRGADAGR